METLEFIAFEPSSAANERDHGRKKQYAARSRQGCLTCRRRRVKCDETRPECQRCLKAHVGCMYVPPAEQESTATLNQPSAPLSVFRSSQECDDLQFWLEVGARNMGRWHCPGFFETLMPQFSQIYESARYAMLAMSTCIHQWHSSDDDARDVVLTRGARYYGMSCRKVLESGNGRASTEAALVSSLALFSYDSFTNNMLRRNVHSDAAISLLRLLKQGFSFNNVSGWRSVSGRAGAQPVIEAAEVYLNEISFSISEDILSPKTENADATPPWRTKLYAPVWLHLDKLPPVFEADPSLTVLEAFSSPLASWKKLQAAPDDLQACHAYLTLWHAWLLTWIINVRITEEVLHSSQSQCRRWHSWLFSTLQPDTTDMLSMRNRALILDEMFTVKLLNEADGGNRANVRAHVNRILALLKSNLQLSIQVANSQQIEASPNVREYRSRQYLRGLAKVVEFIARRADDETSRSQAFAIFALKTNREIQPSIEH